MSKFNSRLESCTIIPRNEDDVLFHADEDGNIMCNLYEYTILPNEEYERILDQPES